MANRWKRISLILLLIFVSMTVINAIRDPKWHMILMAGVSIICFVLVVATGGNDE